MQTSLNALYPCKIKIHLIDEKDFEGFPKSGAAHSSYLPYFRLKAMQFLDENVEKCLYLDSDMLARCDLRELFAIDLKDFIIAAVNDPGSKKRKIRFKENGAEKTHCFDKSYFNSGFLLINVKEFKKERIEEKCENLARKVTFSKTADQNLLNAIIPSNRILHLKFAWNFVVKSLCFVLCKDENPNGLQHTRAEFLQSLKDIKIFHYGEKPWKYLKSFVDINNCNVNDFWWEMALKTAGFKDELLKEKGSIKHYLLVACLGFCALNLCKKFSLFSFRDLIVNEEKDKERLELADKIKDSDFGLCLVLGETILYARRKKKGSLSVVLKAYKIIKNFNKYSKLDFIDS